MTNKNQAIEVPVNSALQANITPIGIDFEMNRLRLGENYCCIFAITDYPSTFPERPFQSTTNLSTTARQWLKFQRKYECTGDRRQALRTPVSASAVRKPRTTRKK